MHRISKLASVGLIMFGCGVWSGCGDGGTEESSLHQGLDLVELEAQCEDAQTHAVKNHKIAICHIPPGNPANAHTIVVSKRATDAHLAHGDTLGGCSCDVIDHPGGGDGDDWDQPGGSDDTPGTKNGKPHKDPNGDSDDGSGGGGSGSTGDDGGSGDDGSGSGSGDDGSGSGSGGDGSGSGSGGDGSGSGGDGSGSGSGDDGSGSGSGGDGSSGGTGGDSTSGSGSGSGGDGSGGDLGYGGDGSGGTSGGTGGGGAGGGDFGVCDPDQALCATDANCPNRNICDLGCCVYVIQ